MKPLVIDAFDFGRLKEQREGDVPVADLKRLSAECADVSGVLHWSLAGGVHETGHPRLQMQVAGEVQLICQRCLKPFAFEIASESVLVLAQDETHADQVEASLEDDSVDVIVGSKALNVLDMVEDEALLAIPQAPKHERCSGQADAANAPDEVSVVVRPSPFAVLKNLKH